MFLWIIYPAGIKRKRTDSDCQSFCFFVARFNTQFNDRGRRPPIIRSVWAMPKRSERVILLGFMHIKRPIVTYQPFSIYIKSKERNGKERIIQNCVHFV